MDDDGDDDGVKEWCLSCGLAVVAVAHNHKNKALTLFTILNM